MKKRGGGQPGSAPAWEQGVAGQKPAAPIDEKPANPGPSTGARHGGLFPPRELVWSSLSRRGRAGARTGATSSHKPSNAHGSGEVGMNRTKLLGLRVWMRWRSAPDRRLGVRERPEFGRASRKPAKLTPGIYDNAKLASKSVGRRWDGSQKNEERQLGMDPGALDGHNTPSRSAAGP